MNANKELSKFVESTADAKESNKTPPSAAREMTAKELKAKLRKFKIA
jgi:hypothetical protein